MKHLLSTIIFYLLLFLEEMLNLMSFLLFLKLIV